MKHNDEYVRRLERRIHNQRVALRENWMIVDQRIQGGAHAAYRPLRTRWWDLVMRLVKENKELHQIIDKVHT